MANNTEDVDLRDIIKGTPKGNQAVARALESSHREQEETRLRAEDVELRDELRSALNLCPKENNCTLDEGRLDRAMQLIQQEANRQKAELLDRLHSKPPKNTWLEMSDLFYGFHEGVKDYQSVIEAERNQLERGLSDEAHK